ncbi:MAG: hypothetical protein RL557_861, partial [archaeon]
MKKAAQKKRTSLQSLSKSKSYSGLLFSSLFIITLLVGFISAADDVAYIYKSKASVDTVIVDTFEDLGLSVELIDETKLPSDFSSYKFIFIGDERFRNIDNLPIYDTPTIISNYYFGEEFGLTDVDGVSKLAATSPLQVKKGNEIMEVYTQARYNGVSIPYYYLATENKATNLQTVAETYTGDGSLGDVISYIGSGTRLLNNEQAEKNICFFGIIEAKYWTNDAKELFKECISFVGVACSSDNDCPDSDSGEAYCYGDDVYQDTQVFECKNAGHFDAQCVDDVVRQLVKECDGTCNDGACICRDQDNDNYDECDIGDEADDGKDEDCNENDPSINPGALEICDGKDNDCDGLTDEGSNICGSGNMCVSGQCIKDCVDNDHDGYDTCSPGDDDDDDGKTIDCNDNDNKVYPGANEICDGKDNDCDGQVDENNGMCESGKICTQGSCVPVTCDEDSDCGTDGFV